MSFNQKQHLADNIEAIHIAFELEKSRKPATSQQQETLRKYCGFGGLKCILLPCNCPQDVQSWNKTDAPLFQLVTQLYQVIRDGAENDLLYRQYVDSLQSSILTAFYTPPQIARAIACRFAEHGIIAGRFLDPSAGTGVFLSAFRETGTKENICYENDPVTGKILAALYPNDTVHVSGFETMDSRYEGYFDMVSADRSLCRK